MVEEIVRFVTNRKKSMQLSKELFLEIKKKLEQAMITEKVYLQHDLSMYQLAKELKTNTSYLSRIIKETYCMSFNTYLNSYRVNEVKRLMKHPKYNDYTIDAISKECGFKNKSTFNKAFRNITGLTPNEYRKQRI